MRVLVRRGRLGVGSEWLRQRTASPFQSLGGDVSQWDEAVVGGGRGFRGGAWNDPSRYLESNMRISSDPTSNEIDTGFRIAEVPEPNSAALMGLVAMGLLRRKRSPRR